MATVYAIYRQTDLTEGRGAVRMDPVLYEDEQQAWDQINHLHGVQGSKPPNCYPRDKLIAGGATTWQDFRRIVGYGGDYYVAPLRVIERSEVADPEEGPK